MIEEAIYIPADKRATKAISVFIGEKEYIFPPNTKVSILSDTLALIIGNWANPVDVEISKDLVLGRTTPQCPRDRIFRIEGNKAINLFETIELSQPEVKAEEPKEVTKKKKEE